MNETRTAVVVGGGIGGLAAGVALHQRGWHVEVLERAEQFREVGAGISLWPNALRALDALGLGDEVRRLGMPDLSAGIRHNSGQWLMRTNTTELVRRHGPVIMIHRADLLETLRMALPKQALTMSAQVHAVREDGDDLMVEHTQGSSRADVLVAADGVRSTVRQLLWPGAAGPRYAGYTSWRFVTPPVRVDAEAGESWGRGERFGFFPLPDGGVYGYATASVPAGTFADDEVAELRHRFGRWHTPIPDLLATLRTGSVLRHDIYELPPPRSYVSGKVVLLGDAAHAMTPDLGQGGGMALEDAVTLGISLGEVRDVTTGLGRYDALRRPRAQRIASQSRRIGKIPHSRTRPVTALRNTAARLAPSSTLLRTLDSVLDWTPPHPQTVSSIGGNRWTR